MGTETKEQPQTTLQLVPLMLRRRGNWCNKPLLIEMSDTRMHLLDSTVKRILEKIKAC